MNEFHICSVQFQKYINTELYTLLSNRKTKENDSGRRSGPRPPGYEPPASSSRPRSSRNKPHFSERSDANGRCDATAAQDEHFLQHNATRCESDQQCCCRGSNFLRPWMLWRVLDFYVFTFSNKLYIYNQFEPISRLKFVF